MKPTAPRTRARLFRDASAALKHIASGKSDEADKIMAEMKKDAGETAILLGVQAKAAWTRKNGNAARSYIEQGLKISTADDLAFFRTAADLGRQIGDDALLETVFRVALKNTPSDAVIRYAAAGYCYRKGVTEAARRHYEAAVNLKPRFVPAMRDLGVLYNDTGERDRALRVLRRAREFDPKLRDALLGRGNARYRAKNYKGAAAIYEAVSRLEPDYSPAYSNLGSAYRHNFQFLEGAQALKRALLSEPENAGGYYNLGNLEKEAANLKPSIQAFRRAVACRPAEAVFHWNLALALLADGQLGEGFDEYEWRWETESFPTKKRDVSQPEWDGGPLEGRTLLIVAEQGIGDALQFLRFVPEAVERAQAGTKKGRVLLEAHDEILDVYADYTGMVELVSRRPGQEPDFDCHIAQLSLPKLLGIKTGEDLPKAPYINSISADRFPVPDLDPAKLNVGVVWGGNPAFPGDDIRSSKVEFYAPLFGLDGVQCYSLQKGPREADLANAPPSLIPLSRDITSFADTVSIVRQLDVTVTTCTSVAHLVGGMGCPVFVLLSHNPDWRWLQHRDDSPWYPSARLFRQARPGDWPGVIEKIGAALGEMQNAKIS
tara:strand:- start:1916 stop:3724 length:1809 start_codon:yes stop_codon:yes gene_type:complete